MHKKSLGRWRNNSEPKSSKKEKKKKMRNQKNQMLQLSKIYLINDFVSIVTKWMKVSNAHFFFCRFFLLKLLHTFTFIVTFYFILLRQDQD